MKGVKEFRPNDETHKAFGDALRDAAHCGVKVLAVDCVVAQEGLSIDSFVKVEL